MLNDDKTEFLIIGTRQQLSKVSIQSIKIGQTPPAKKKKKKKERKHFIVHI